MALLEVENLNIRFHTPDGEVAAATNLSFTINEGDSLGIVGESGSGKTQMFLAIMGLLAKNGSVTGSIRFQGRELIGLSRAQLNAIRGVEMAMIFQDPMTSLNPFLRVSRQMNEILIEHKGMSENEADRQAIAMLERVGIPDAARRYRLYPHEFSGGMRQRVMIAMALLCRPKLLIADEPTTALDVTVQAQILELLTELRQEVGTSIAMITHDLGVIAGLCDQVMVMYGGRVAERASAETIFYHPQHPYTQGLLLSVPRLDKKTEKRLVAIPGQPPNLQKLSAGCPFTPRCPYRFEPCPTLVPQLRPAAGGGFKACHLEALP